MTTDPTRAAEIVVEQREDFVGDVDVAVRIAIGQHHEWQERASPSSKKQNRIPVRDGDVFVMRRPFQRRGVWHVSWAGMPRLVRPHWSNGNLSFEADWS